MIPKSKTSADKTPIEDEAKETFLAALRRPLRTSLGMQNFKGYTTNIVIERALQMELEDEDDVMSITSLRQVLPRDEEYRLRQAIQCTICLNLGHSVVDCNMWVHYPICHSRAHTMDQCGYNILNRLVAPIRRIEPQRTNYQNDLS